MKNFIGPKEFKYYRCFLFSQRSRFVIRATCIDIFNNYNALGCVSYNYWNDWDPDFVELGRAPFPAVSINISFA